MLDDRDRGLLSILQADAETPLSKISERLNLSASACSRRIARLRAEGFITGQVATVDRHRLNLPTTVFALIRVTEHKAEGIERFREAVQGIPEIVEAHRLTGHYDYLLEIALPTIEHYDVVYRRLTARVSLAEVSACTSMDVLKAGTVLPTSYV
jgi:Lrp/AsnC family transcriptional regulator